MWYVCHPPLRHIPEGGHPKNHSLLLASTTAHTFWVGKVQFKNISKIKTENIRIRPKSGEVYRLKADNKKAKRLIKWEPKYSGKTGLIKGLENTIEWFSKEENLNKYKTDHYTT